MNVLKLTILLTLIIAFSACKKNDDGGDPGDPITCDQADWVGTYKGTEVCDGNPNDITVTITARGSDSIIIRKTLITNGGSSLSREYNPIKPSGCELAYTVSGPNFGTFSVGGSIDGSNLTLNDTSADTSTPDLFCNITATRQ